MSQRQEEIQRVGLEAVAVAFPDEGAKKRFGGFFEKAGYPVSSSAVCTHSTAL